MKVGRILSGLLLVGFLGALGLGTQSCTKRFSVTGPVPVQPTTVTPTVTPTPSYTSTESRTPTPTATSTDTVQFTPTPTYTGTSTNTFTATQTHTNTNSPTRTPTSTETNTPTATYTFTHTPTPRNYVGSYNGAGSSVVFTGLESVAGVNGRLAHQESTRYVRTDVSFTPEDECSGYTTGRDVAASSIPTEQFFTIDAGTLPPRIRIRPANSCSVNGTLNAGPMVNPTKLYVDDDGDVWVVDNNSVKEISQANVLLNNIDLGVPVNSVAAGNDFVYVMLSTGSLVRMNKDGSAQTTIGYTGPALRDIAYNSTRNILEGIVANEAFAIDLASGQILTRYSGGLADAKSCWVLDDVLYVVDSNLTKKLTW